MVDSQPKGTVIPSFRTQLVDEGWMGASRRFLRLALTLLSKINVSKSIQPVRPSNEVLAWLSFLSEVQMICIWSS